MKVAIDNSEYHVESRLGQLLVERGVAQARPAEYINYGSVANWLRSMYKTRPDTREAFYAAILHFKPAPAFLMEPVSPGSTDGRF